MTDETGAKPPADGRPAGAKPAQAPLSDSASSHAPFLYFENASAFGDVNGIVQVTLEAMRLLPNVDGKTVQLERVVVAHLRMNHLAANSLRHALEGALLLTAKAGSEAKN